MDSFLRDAFSRFHAACAQLTKPITIHVTYCGSCGNIARYDRLVFELRQIFTPKEIKFTECVIGVCKEELGLFEVEIVGDKVLHSKKNGDGFVDTDDKMWFIVDEIKKLLKTLR